MAPSFFLYEGGKVNPSKAKGSLRNASATLASINGSFKCMPPTRGKYQELGALNAAIRVSKTGAKSAAKGLLSSTFYTHCLHSLLRIIQMSHWSLLLTDAWYTLRIRIFHVLYSKLLKCIHNFERVWWFNFTYIYTYIDSTHDLHPSNSLRVYNYLKIPSVKSSLIHVDPSCVISNRCISLWHNEK